MPEVQQVLPKYLQVANHYRERIISGALQAGDELPSERQIAEIWGISRPTATRALASLRNQGLVEARQGSGTYVRAQVLFHRRARDRYRQSRGTGLIYGVNEYAEIAFAGLERMPPWVSEAFGARDSERGIKRVRRIHSDDDISELSTSWFHPELASLSPLLLRTDRIRQGTLRYVEETAGRVAVAARDHVLARMASAPERAALSITSRSAAVLVIHHRALDASDRPVECVEAVYPPERWIFEQEYPIQP
jgi:GntR family transcriptional regulator